jgi:GT2 family glycosyltransferase
MVIAAQRESRPAPVTDSRVTVVVLTSNRADDACRTVAALLRLPERPAVIVVDNASDDGTSRLVRNQFPNVAVVSLARHIGAAGWNAGARRATTPYVALCSDRTTFAPGALTAAADALDGAPRLAVVTARVLLEPDRRDDPRCRALLDHELSAERDIPGRPVLDFQACAAVARRDALLEAGGFEPHFHVCLEPRLLAVDLASRGWVVSYVPEVVAYRTPSAPDDALDRAWMQLRNELWFTWLRRPWGVAARRTWAVLRASRQDALTRRALREAAAELPWVWHRRAVVPQEVERRLRLLDKQPSGASAVPAPPGLSLAPEARA